MATDISSNNVVTSYDGSRATTRGTKIIQPGKDMDKNSFLKILSAELSNQDPDNAKDSTQYISQMAQFTSMEQMANLNTTMSSFASNSLVGKGVTMKDVDSSGTPYTGVIKAVATKNGETTISVAVSVNGQNEYKDFPMSNIDTVLDVPDSTIAPITNINGNMSFLSAASLIGKQAEFSDKDASGNVYKGIVKGVSKENGVINLSVKVDGQDTLKTFTYDKLTKVNAVE
jgi:flagellar basal-body rod modification protein FlgD